ncbi:GNAT family N-acetyltransferase [Brevibacillus dissolubilis]|uniref:GNAT family N-acetyltransferase n=1 Tax=Brevibacillus dissolubilis TaxID=1844116 RepID=UPI001116E50F|nr:GNAT family N-acetyltransferase [Brevibacillus dissolubilis]
MAQDVRIRILDAGDAPVFKELRLMGLRLNPEAFGASYEDAVKAGDDYWTSLLQRLPGKTSFTLGAFAGEELIGIVGFYHPGGLKAGHKGTLVSMYVHPEKRQGGVGKKLVQALIERVREEKSAEQIQLAVVTTNEAAAALYKSCGFEVYGEEKRALKVAGQYYDEWLMVLFL